MSEQARPAATKRATPRTILAGLALLVALGLGLLAAARLAMGGCSPFAGTTCVRVLFLGNSYTYVNDLPATFAAIARSAGRNVETGMVANGAETLTDHADSSESLGAIRGSQWDYVVVQEQSEIPAVPALAQAQMDPAVRSLAQSIRAAGATPLLLETWAHRDGWSAYRLDYAAMQSAIDRAYLALAGELGIRVATAGEAWQAALTQQPAITLWQSDGSHPTPAGTYLAACVLYERLFNAGAVGIPESDGLPADVAHALQVIAAEVR